MSIVVNNDRLECILTEYGLRRIAEAIEDSSVTLNLGKIKVGDSNGEYYVPSESITALRNPIPNGEFSVIQKELLEDGLTVSFECIIPESFGGYDIREVGLFEITEEGDKLFAVATQQPIVKPDLDDNYYMSINYYILLKGANLSEAYDSIILDPNSQVATEEDLETLLSTLLFTQGNLSAQIGYNSEIIGYNRPTELYEFAVANRNAFGYSASCNSYASFVKYVDGEDNVFGYWIFDYPKRNEFFQIIKDISSKGYNISTSQNVNLFERTYEGITSALVFTPPTYFYVDPSTPLSLVENNADVPFTMMFVVNPIALESDRTLLARSNYSINANTFEIKELSDNSLFIRLFTDSSNYITFTSSENAIPVGCHVVLISYDNIEHTIVAYVNGVPITLTKEVTGTYTHMFDSVTTLYGYTCDIDYIKYTYTTSPSTGSPQGIYNADGSPYDGEDWTVDQNQVYFNGEIASYIFSRNKITSGLYAWSYGSGLGKKIIYTKTEIVTTGTVLYNSDYTVYSGDEFKISSDGSRIIYNNSYATVRDGFADIQPATLYAWVYNDGIEKIWANSNSNPTVMFNEDGTIHPSDSTWNLTDGHITYVPTGNEAVYNSSYNKNASKLDTTSCVINNLGQVTDPINSNVALVGIALYSMSEEDMRIFSMELGAQVGQNPAISPS